MHHSSRCGWLAATAVIVLGVARAAETLHSPSAPDTLPKKVLDLKPPDIRKLYTPEQIKQLLSATIDPDLEGVEVEGAREKLINEPVPLWRAVPSWLLPRSSDDTAKMYGKPDATFPYARPPAASPSPMAGESRRYDR